VDVVVVAVVDVDVVEVVVVVFEAFWSLYLFICKYLTFLIINLLLLGLDVSTIRTIAPIKIKIANTIDAIIKILSNNNKFI
jgi:hypothetical protein